MQWQAHKKLNYLVFAARADHSAVQSDNFLSDCKTESGSACFAGARGVQPVKLLKYLLKHRLRDRRAVIYKAQLHMLGTLV